MKINRITLIITVLLLCTLLVSSIIEYSQNNRPIDSQQPVFSFDGKTVYENELMPYISYYTRISGDDNAEVKNAAIDNYIRSSLFDKFSTDIGIIASDEEVAQYIKDTELFQTDGKFIPEKYNQFITNIGVQKHLFENEIRKDLVILKLMKEIDSNTNIKDYYFDIASTVLAQKRNIEKVRVNLADIEVDVKNEDLKEEYEINKELYKEPDDILFTKFTYIHPDNQKNDEDIVEKVKLETNSFYQEISKVSNENLVELLKYKGLKNASMTLNSDDFKNLVGFNRNEALVNANVKLTDGMSYVDKTEIENGIVNIYYIENVEQGDYKSFDAARDYIERNVLTELKIKKAYEKIASNNGDLKKSVGDYLNNYVTEVVNPLSNDKSEQMYKLSFALPFNEVALLEENNNYYFIKVLNSEKVELTNEQVDYFKTSQNNMYKQFIVLSLYDTLKKEYDLKLFKKES